MLKGINLPPWSAFPASIGKWVLVAEISVYIHRGKMSLLQQLNGVFNKWWYVRNPAGKFYQKTDMIFLVAFRLAETLLNVAWTEIWREELVVHCVGFRSLMETSIQSEKLYEWMVLLETFVKMLKEIPGLVVEDHSKFIVHNHAPLFKSSV